MTGERGAIGGVEVLPFGLLVFVVGALLLANAWAVVDAKLGVDTAAREAGRAYVEAPGGPAAAARAADQAGRDAIRGVGRDPDRLSVGRRGGGDVRCSIIETTATYVVPAVRLPFVGGFGHGFTVRGRHRDVVDPFTADRTGDAACG